MHGVPTHFLGVLAEVDMRSRRGENVDMSSLRYVDRSLMVGHLPFFFTYLVLEPELLLVPLSP